jgi:hypothetical protein
MVANTPDSLEESHRLIQIYNDDAYNGKYGDYKHVFASNFVSVMVLEYYYKDRRAIMLRFLN